MFFLYLHGFASSPLSAKAQYLHDRFRALNLSLALPDLNQGDFTHLTLTRQIQQVEALLPPTPVTLIGSSLGGLTAAWLGDRHPQIERLVLLAPAFGFLAQWLPKLGQAQLDRWQAEGTMPIYHYSEARELPLSHQFVIDAARYDETKLCRPVPTLILHGRSDEVISIEMSRNYAAKRSWVKLIELESDHALGDVQAEIWSEIQQFCDLKGKIERNC